MTTINGRQYEWADISLFLGGKPVIGVHAISYKETQEKSLLYGKGNRPLSVQSGNVGYEGSITLLQSEVETLKELGRSVTGRPSVLGLNLNATVCYGDPSKGNPMITDSLFNIQFTEMGKDISQGDKNMEITLPFICTDIIFGM